MTDLDTEQRVISKVAWRLIPFLCVCYMAAFLDRMNVGFAKEQMAADLGLSNAVYGAGAGIFFVGYCLFEVPSNLILERVGARIWFARIMIVWSLVSACMIFVRGPTSFYALRFALGIAEAGFFPGVIFYMTSWFPAAHRSRTTAVFMMSAVLSNVLGSLVSGFVLGLDGVLGLRGWKWLFLVEAVPSLVLGVVVFLRLPRTPREARWLEPEDVAWLERRLEDERAALEGGRETTLWQALTDSRVLLLCVVYFALVVGGYGLDFFMPTLIKQVFPSATPKLVGAINAVPQLFAMFVMIAHGRSSDRRRERKLHFSAAVWWAAAGLLLASLPLPAAAALAALGLAVSGRWSAVAPFWALSTAFLSGTAAAGAIALINSVGNLGGFVGPYIMGWFKDATGDYRVGLRVLALVMALGGALALTIEVRRPALRP